MSLHLLLDLVGWGTFVLFGLLFKLQDGEWLLGLEVGGVGEGESHWFVWGLLERDFLDRLLKELI
jgi:hypothetical protein